MPIGTWMVSMKVDNDEIWNNYVKKNKIKGFSIEGYFADRLNRPKDKRKDTYSEDDKLLNDIIDVLKESKTNTK
jgi:hypothetical protein